MVAVLTPTPSTHPHDVLERPVLRLVPGGRGRRVATSSRPSAAAYRRRRVFAALVALTVAGLVIVALLAASSFVGGLSAGPAPVGPATASAVVDVAPIVSSSYVVRSGDTVWAIAHKLQPEGDVRPLVDELAARAGSAGLQVGQRIDLSGLVD